MEILKLAEYREQNRKMGWRATADVIARHIVTMTEDPLDFDILKYRIRDKATIDPLSRCKVRDINKYLERINTAFFIIMYSFDDSREDAVACYRHLFHHHCIIANWRNMNVMSWMVFSDKLRDLSGYKEFYNRYEDFLSTVNDREPEVDIDSRFH